MKNLLLIIYFSFNVLTLVNAQTIPNAGNSLNTLVLKYSKNLNGQESSLRNIITYKNGLINNEKQDLYLFTFPYTNGKPVMADFYTIDKNKYAYRELALFDSVAIDINQLYDILLPMSAGQVDEYLRSFQYIFLIDLDSPNRLNPNEFKTLLVKPYFLEEHFD